MNNDLYGILEYNKKEYPFVLDKRIVKLIGEPFQYINDFRNVDEAETIKGVTSGNREIVFLKCKFIDTFFSSTVSFSIQAYAVSDNNVGIPCDFTFSRSSFESDAINSFFSPQKAVEIDIDTKDWTGEIDIKVSPFKDTTLEFDYLNSKCQLSISRHVRIEKEPTNIGRVKSLFAFEHSQIQPLTKVIDDYLALYDFLCFTNYNSNILFKDIYICQKNSDGLFEKTATVYIFSNKTEYENTRRNSITVDDIPTDKLGAVFSKVASLRKHDNRISFYFPENNDDAKYIDPGKWLITALNFEGLFNTCFPNFKFNQNAKFKKAKELILERIDNYSDEKRLTKKETYYYNKCRRQIELYEGQLEEKFNFVFKNNKNALTTILQYNESHFGIKKSENYGEIYADYRNKTAHGSVEPLTEKEVAVYRILRPLIYFLILSEVGLTIKEKQKITEKLFR